MEKDEPQIYDFPSDNQTDYELKDIVRLMEKQEDIEKPEEIIVNKSQLPLTMEEEIKKPKKQEKEMIGPQKPKKVEENVQVHGNQEKPIMQNQENLKIPCSHQVTFLGHTGSITAISLDKTGGRMITGSSDKIVRFWDFHGMNMNMNSFRQIEPILGHVIRNLSFSADSNEILVIAGNFQPKIINRDGKDIAEFIRGDMQIKDMSNTKGHAGLVYDGCFSPTEKNIIGTCSLDGTIRIWDRNARLVGIEKQMAHIFVHKCKDQKSQHTEVTAVNFSRNGKLIVGVCKDGTIQGFESSGSSSKRPVIYYEKTHDLEQEATKLIFFNDNQKFLTRSMDCSMKIWDIRSQKQALNAWQDLPNQLPGSKISLSPDENLIVCGTSVGIERDEKKGYLFFFDSKTFDLVAHICVGEFSATDVVWHSVLNQIFFGSTNNKAIGLQNPNLSENGALLCANKEPRKVQIDDLDTDRPIQTPHLMPLFRDQLPNKKQQQEEMRKDKKEGKKPEAPLSGRGRGGKTSGPNSMTQYLMKAMNKLPEEIEDPVKALHRYHNQAEKNPTWVGKAQKTTQPKQVYDTSIPEKKELLFLSKIDKICEGCGKKMCTCHKPPKII